MPVPDPGPAYGAQVWRAIERDVSAARRSRWPAGSWNWASAAMVAAALLVAGFLAGRHLGTTGSAPSHISDSSAGKQVLLLAVVDHLERSQRMLAEVVNFSPESGGEGQLSILAEQERAEELVTENRLYRQSAEYIGQIEVAEVLEELERVLLDVARTPPEISSQELENLQARLQAQDILFKIRVLKSNVGVQQPARAEKL
jgi:hypothetical protein